MKKYTNNVFLNNLNDFTRSAYAVDNTIQSTQFDKDIVINREMDSNLFVQQKESFDNNNSNTNSLLEEIQILKKTKTCLRKR